MMIPPPSTRLTGMTILAMMATAQTNTNPHHRTADPILDPCLGCSSSPTNTATLASHIRSVQH